MNKPIVLRNRSLKWTFRDMSSWKGELRYSEESEIGSVKWKLGIEKRYDELWGYLTCFVPENEKGWICAVDPKFTLYKQSGENTHRVVRQMPKYLGHEMIHVTDRIEMMMNIEYQGYRNYYVENNSIVFGIEFDVSYYNVSKKIPGYTDLTIKLTNADLYLNKGFLSTVADKFHNLLTKKAGEDEVIIIDDVRPHLLLRFLMFLHPVHLDLYEFHDRKMIALADKYGAKKFHEKNEDYFIGERNIPPIEKLQLAEMYGYERLARRTIDSMESLEKVKKLVKTVQFDVLDKELRKRVFMKLVELL